MDSPAHIPDERPADDRLGAAERGAVATEYVFLATLIAMVLITSVAYIGEWVRNMLDSVGGMI